MGFLNIRHFSKKHFSILLASYTLIFIIPLVVSFLTYLQAQRALESEISRANSAVLELTRSYLDNQLIQARQLQASIMLNSRVNNFMSFHQLGGSERLLLHHIVGDLSAMHNQYPFISNFYIYFRSSSVVATPSATYPASMFFEYIHTYNPNYLLIESTLPFSRQGDARASLVIMIDRRNISMRLDELQWMDGGIIYIVDAHGNLVASTTEATLPDILPDFEADGASWTIMHINGEAILVSSVLSAEQGWRYVAMLPTHVFSYQIDYIRNFFMGMLILSMFIGAVIIIAVAYRSYAPVHSIITRLPQLNLFEEQKPIVRNHLLMGLLGGNLTFSPDFSENLRAYDVELPHNHFVVLTITPAEESTFDKDISESLIAHLIQSPNWVNVHLYACDNMHKSRVVLLCNIPDSLDEFSDNFEVMLGDVRDFFLRGKTYYIGVGSVHSGAGISTSYSESVTALNHMSEATNIRRYSNVIDSMHFHYPLQTEQRLFDNLKSGNYEQCRDVLDHIIAENVQTKRELSASKRRALLLDIFNTLNKVLDDLKIILPQLADSRELEYCDTLDEARVILLKYFEDICRYVAERRKSRNIKLLDDALIYMDSMYKDSQCSLNATAEAMNISVPYLSRFFKEQTGVNFNIYLNQLRVNEAKLLLQRPGGNESITQIAVSVGFNSDITFIRVFKKFTGKTPGSFRRESL